MSTEATSQRTSWRQVVGNALSGNGALLGLVALVVLLSLASSRFLTGANLLNVGIQASVIAILAFGMTFVIITAGIDLSVGSIAALAAIVTAWSASTAGLNPLFAVVMGLVVGSLAGAVNGGMVAYGRIPAFVATLAMLSIARGLTLVIASVATNAGIRP